MESLQENVSMTDQQVKKTEEVTENTIIPDMKTGVLIEAFGFMFLIYVVAQYGSVSLNRSFI